MNKEETKIALEDLGWTHWNDAFCSAENYYKMYPTKYPCFCNERFGRIQITLDHHTWEGNLGGVSCHNSYSVELCAELPDGTWVKYSQYALQSIAESLGCVDTLIRSWEVAVESKLEKIKESSCQSD